MNEETYKKSGLRFTPDQYLDAIEGYFGGSEGVSHNAFSFVKTRKDHECSGIEHNGNNISKGEYAVCERAIDADNGRVSCYICIPCCNDWLDEVGEYK